MGKPVGIENIKLVIAFVLNLFTTLSATLADGKITFWEGFGLIPELKEVGKFIPKLGEIKAEIQDLDPAEAQQLNEYIKEKFNLPHAEVEAKIEAAMDWVLASYSLFIQFKK